MWSDDVTQENDDVTACCHEETSMWSWETDREKGREGGRRERVSDFSKAPRSQFAQTPERQRDRETEGGKEGEKRRSKFY